MILIPFYFFNITLKTDLLTFEVAGAVFEIAGEMRQLPAYFDNPECAGYLSPMVISSDKHVCLHLDKQLRVIGFSLMLRVKLPVGLQVTNI